MRFVRRFVPQQIAICARVEHSLIFLTGEFAERQRNGAVGEFTLYPCDDAADLVSGEYPLAALEHKGAKAERIPLAAAGVYLLLGKDIALAAAV